MRNEAVNNQKERKILYSNSEYCFTGCLLSKTNVKSNYQAELTELSGRSVLIV